MRRHSLRLVSAIPACMTIALAATAVTAIGCERQISSSKKTTVERDGTVETEEERVVRNPDGSITKEEKTRKTDPSRVDP